MLVLDWMHPILDVPDKGLSTKRTATPQELQALQAALEILSCDALEAHYRIKPAGGGGFKLEGRFEVRLTQACVVSLEPVPDRVKGEFAVEFRPEIGQRPAEKAERDALAEETVDPFAEVEVETIENGVIDAGRIVYEEIASLLNPYPRAAGTSFDWQDPKAGAAGERLANHPFAKLAVLKSKKSPQ